MKFHSPSFLVGLAVAAAVMASRDRLRPVAVELGALGVHMLRLARAIAERQREHVEDLWAEVEDRVHAQEETRRERRTTEGRAAPRANGRAAPRANGRARAHA
jgi:hypothetical protein